MEDTLRELQGKSITFQHGDGVQYKGTMSEIGTLCRGTARLTLTNLRPVRSAAVDGKGWVVRKGEIWE